MSAKNKEYLYLDFPSGNMRRENLYLHGVDKGVDLTRLRVTFRGEKPSTIHVPYQVAGNRELIMLLANEAPNTQINYFGMGA